MATIGALLADAVQRLRASGSDTPRLDAEVLLALCAKQGLVCPDACQCCGEHVPPADMGVDHLWVDPEGGVHAADSHTPGAREARRCLDCRLELGFARADTERTPAVRP